ncbi:MAG: hypothetical protein P1U56_23800 [Saprospiraceae bacterium]|nr:hypothetical protein [Saprospiraceae bacterium]
MKKSVVVFLVFLCPIILLSQNVEVLGGLKADSLNVNSGLITNAANPISPQDAATKAYVDASTNPIYTVGLSAEQGGYIFWVSPDGKHGIVAETIDIEYSTTNFENAVSNPSNHSADGANFRDWRVPTFYELNEMYVQKAAIGGFSNAGSYHSSTGNALHFGTGAIIGNMYFPYTQGNKLRAVRTF